MDISAWIGQAKQTVLGSLEQHVYDQATANDLVETALKSLVEAAVNRMHVEAPMATGMASTILGFLKPLVAAADQFGLDDQLMKLASSHGLDSALQERVINGLTRYLKDNGSRLMTVALETLVKKLSSPST